MLDDGTFKVARYIDKKDFHGLVYNSIDSKGNIIIKTIAGTLNLPNETIRAWEFCSGLVVFENEEGKMGIVDESGAIRIPCIFNGYTENEKDRTLITIELGYDEQYIDWLDKRLSKDKKTIFYYDIYVNRICKYDNYDINIISENRLHKIRNSDGLIVVSNTNGLWGLVDGFAREITPCIYFFIYDFNNGYFEVSDGNKIGIIDKTGRKIVFGNYSNIELCNDYIYVTHSKYGCEKWHHYTDEEGYNQLGLYKEYDKLRFNYRGELLVLLRGDWVAIPKDYDWCDNKFHEGFLSVCKNEKWGIINTRLEVVVDCIYDNMFRFDNGIAIAKTGNVSVVINNFGHTLFFGDYNNIERYDAYYLYVCHSRQGHYDIYNGIGVLLFSSNDIYSRIQIPETDKMSSNRFMPTEILPLDRNYMQFSVSAKYESKHVKKWGICGINGRIYIEACLDKIGGIGCGLISTAKLFTEIGCSRQLKWGYIDLAGNIVVNYKYAYAQPFSHGLAQVSYRNQQNASRELALISTDGKELTDFVYERFEFYSKDEMLAYYQHNNEAPVRITEQGAIHYEYYEDETCKDVYLYGYDWCSKVCHGLCYVMKGHRYGIIEASGTISFPLSEMGDVKIAVNPDGFVAFNKRDVFKDVTKEGRLITYLNDNRIELPVGIHWCEEWMDGFIAVESNGKWGLLNTELEFVLETKYESIQYIENKRFLCCSKEKDKESYSIYSIETDSYLQLPYDDCSHFESGCAIVSKVIKEIKHPWTNNVDRTYAYGLIDYLGRELLPCECSKIQFKEPIKYDDNNSDNYEEPYDWESGYKDAFEDEPGATWGREW